MRRNNVVARWTLPVVMLVAAVSTTSAQRPHLGARVGYDFQSKNPVVSVQASVPVTPVVEFYPSADIYLPNSGTMMGFNGDLKLNLPTSTGPNFYLGGGLGVLTRSRDDVSSTDVGANAILGVESRLGWVHPFVEGRAFISEQNRASLLLGLNFTLGR
jgi:hypothetical protein